MDKMMNEAKEEMEEHGSNSFGKKVAKKLLGAKMASTPKAKAKVFGEKKVSGKHSGKK